jgi:predicted TIM-barrel fold metal-dependent hydrolase
MPQLVADALKFAGMSKEQASTFPQRAVVGADMTAASIAAMPKMISTDAHVMEPDELWLELPKRLQEHLPKVAFRNSPPGASNPELRLRDQDTDGVEAEILFPNYGMALFGIDDRETQHTAFQLYNDWIANFCKADSRRLYGAPCLSVYDMKATLKEFDRAQSMGLKGAMLWQVPDPELPFTSAHYDPLWAACAEAGQPVICHILTGHSYTKEGGKARGVERIRNAVNRKQDDSANTLFDFIFSGAFDRHPNLRLLLAESEIGWLPFLLQQWDYYFERFRRTDDLPIKRKPSEIFNEHVFGTFLEDYVGTRAFPWWGEKNCMWSNDYPHFNMTFPHSREVVEFHLQGLPEDKRQRLIRDNAIKLFGLKL